MAYGLRRTAAIVIGSIGIAVGINFFLLPFKILDGGIIGLSLILHYLFHLQVGVALMGCSLPIFALAWWMDRGAFYGSAQGLLAASIAIEVLAPFRYHFMYVVRIDPLTSAILGGTAIGLSLGLMLRMGVSTGGTDLLSYLLARLRNWNPGLLVMLSDMVVVSAGGILISAETFFLSILSIVAGGMATSIVTFEGFSFARKK